MKKVVLFAVLMLGLSVPAQAVTIHFQAVLSGPAEAPPNASPGTGFAFVSLDDVAHTLTVSATFSGLLANTLAAHIHCCTAVPLAGAVGVATQLPSFVGFPLGVTSGSFANTYNTVLPGSWSATFITNNGGTPLTAEAALAQGLIQGRAYFNIHTQLFPGGEIRGFLTPVPEPATLTLLGLGLGAAALRRRWKSRS